MFVLLWVWDCIDGIPQYYISVDTVENDLKGLAAFILASIEYEQL